jgi:hypothetical protein
LSAEVDEALLRELAEPLVAELSPAEGGELFPLLSEAYFNDPEEALESNTKGGGPLAFGLPELTMLLTPVMLAAMNEVVRYVVADAMAKGKRVTVRAIRRLLGRRREEPGPDDNLELTADQWAEVRRIVERVARQGGVPEARAQLIADAVVGQGRMGDVGS